ncbi:uncharacterized protein BN750_01394 [Bacteroides sp. CAG:661]|uniref:DUF5723 family protein n=1 Tax=Mediterranea massiliensis TaxID=1841865 RepID=UPI00033CC7F0|nr:DUF5723 family protein [Mediterranea massiliensis]CCZ49544.1 uncharacterized protein BN750_01394 [Bacteroides sp. CAG:661]
MKKYIICIIIAITAGLNAKVSAQGLNSGYFTDGYTFAHQLNPAFDNDHNYFSIPVLGNINIGTRGNVGLGSFLFPYKNGQLTTFMNSSVSAEEFLGGLKDNNRIGASVNLSFLSAGFKAWGGFNTIDIGLRSNTYANLPYELFEFMKLGQQGASSTYDLQDLGINSSNYIEIALGHSRNIGDKLRVGAKVKFLLGGAYVDVKMNDMSVTLAEDKWMVKANGEMNAALKGLSIPTKAESGKETSADSQKDLVDWNNIEVNNPGLTGFGLAVDLGATYKVMDNLTVSAALKDFGFINWSNNTQASTANSSWEFNGFQNIAVDSEMGDDDPNSLNSQLDRLTDDLEDFASFHRQSAGGSLTRMLSATLNVGVEYALPMYKRLSFGLLSSTRFNGPYTLAEGRLSANIAPLSWFSAGINGAVSNVGSSMGWIVNFHPKGFNLFVGMDQLIGKVSKQYIPINHMNSNVSLGFNVAF